MKVLFFWNNLSSTHISLLCLPALRNAFQPFYYVFRYIFLVVKIETMNVGTYIQFFLSKIISSYQ